MSNDTALDQDRNQLLIITGPNMAGKSTYIRQVAIITIMAQMGSFVPAEAARIGLVDTIYTRIGANENLARGESTFMVEMLETSNILNNAGPRSLVILDEIGRGTSTFDGVSIAWAVCEFLNKKSGARPKTLFATHFHELGELERSLEGIRNYNITARESGDEIVFMRKIVPGVADKSYGIQVGRLAGLPEEVVQRSKEVLLYLEEEKISEEALAKKLSGRRRRETVTPLPLFNPRGAANAAELLELKRTPPGPAAAGADAASHPILEEIRQLNLEAMTPLEALNQLHALKQKLLADSALCPKSKNSS
ncbi:MAG: DNA mismatch repair protein MutS [bacterium ADurb.Bin431]|nr:MAG: DNA mismatch repair protein MutS [bacterium ADurb.Bin431]